LDDCLGPAGTVSLWNPLWGVATLAACYIICGPGTSLIRCFEPNTLIKTPTGQIPIYKLKKDDFVLTHDYRLSRVLATHHS